MNDDALRAGVAVTAAGVADGAMTFIGANARTREHDRVTRDAARNMVGFMCVG